MSWNQHMDVPYFNTGYPYNTAGSLIEYFEGLTYQHVNFIFDGASQVQDTVYPSTNTNFYKFGASESGTISYYDHCDPYEVNDHELQINENRRPMQDPIVTNESTTAINTEWEGNVTANSHDHPIECTRRHHRSRGYQVVWQDNVDPDNMTYEELLDLGEAVGTQSRGLSQELISLLPASKYKWQFFFRKKSRSERCVICQMEYKRGDWRITLPCKHIYHARCGSRWLSINKACPICYTEVFGDASKQ
ncbi:E3 ubiquitin-protein ligase BIG BROTHER-like [Tripterygium wilfordii]|uniref:E3 ubiquitin-protein ligase BIG BROTHER-like n=1 Tax=Tripterygium wilfordii TaxID=458696 RepID=UPI0018F85A86|nr:E3 ubiquitin-protein ligase BIG BROTHER-like [Tripterygium wilfordii]XP_038698420.1 E3 ubiquitin-protein ligase BIG BROTHER-like [Tripterygium wilfordii]XP_038698421.1 E3 ubiquitin-protein ligase BIG BROTHER-like [Tripterygium wilfordii]XP_038698422.1 E3 ubiquitin-protein ligase BIG BROTHER-like [Tripterygium wilfordii]